ncbi:MAG TPA: UDP-3-O-(3-hydroxymyristoyl)glucosamine N-acyltransferase [Candidatus Limnocylindria bacterium]|nr:UDP-3-O-(3-hydroxymyristoyl)glucosamine N-acyltransferase [Candidatus Limnocylindria bacterium]
MKLGDVARLVGGELRGDAAVEIKRVAALEDAGPGALAFYADTRHAGLLASTRASAVLVGPDVPPLSCATIVVPHPYAAFVQVVEVLHPRRRPAPGIHPTAVVARSAQIGPGAAIGPCVVIGERVRLGRNAVLHAGVVLYDDVVVGDDFTAHARAVVREGCRIGHRVILHAGAVIGSDGFGYLPLPDGPKAIPQIGGVVLEDDVEIGANTTVDRAALGDTVVERGAKIDNLVMVAHGCRVGAGSLLAGQVGLAGGTVVGRGVMLGGQVGSAGHLTIGDGARVGAKTGISSSLPAGGTYASGIPALEVRLYRRLIAAWRRLPELRQRVRRLERLQGIEPEDDSDG